MDRWQLAQIIEDRKTVETYVKYVGVYALGDKQALILGQTCYDDPNVISHAHCEIQQNSWSHMLYTRNGYGTGGSFGFPTPISEMENPFHARYYNKGIEMLLDAGITFPKQKRGYPELTAWKNELLKRDRLGIRETRAGEYYALIDCDHPHSSLREMSVLRMGPVLDETEGIFVPGMHEHLLTTRIYRTFDPSCTGAYGFSITYYHADHNEDVFLFSRSHFNNPETSHRALNITDWWKAEYGATDGKFIKVTKDDLMLLQEHSEVDMNDLVEHFAPRLIDSSKRLKNDARQHTGILPG